MAKKVDLFLHNDENKFKAPKTNTSVNSRATAARTSTRKRTDNVDAFRNSTPQGKAAAQSKRKRTDNVDKPSATELMYLQEREHSNEKLADSESSKANRELLGISDNNGSEFLKNSSKTADDYISEVVSKRIKGVAEWGGYKPRQRRQWALDLMALASPSEHPGPVQKPDTLDTEYDIIKTAYNNFMTPERNSRFSTPGSYISDNERTVYQEFQEKFKIYDTAMSQRETERKERDEANKAQSIVSATVKNSDFESVVATEKQRDFELSGKKPEELHEYFGVMSEKERDTYQYLLAKSPMDAAEFLNLFNRKFNKAKEKEAFEYGKAHPWKAAGKRMSDFLPNAFDSTTFWAQNLANGLIGEKKLDPYAQGYTSNLFEKSQYEAGIKENTDDFGDALVGLGFGAADVATAMAINSVSMGMGTALNVASNLGDAQIDAYRRGASPMEVAVIGAATAGIEYLTERISLGHLDKLLKGKSRAEGVGLLKNLLKVAPDDGAFKKFLKISTYGGSSQFFAEGGEELIANVSNTVFDYFTMGDRSQVNLSIKNYMRTGLSESDAVKAAVLDKFLKEPALEFVMGGTLGGLMGGGAATFNLGKALIGSSDAGSVSADGATPGSAIAARFISTDEAMKLLQKSGIKVTKDQAENLKRYHNERAELAHTVARVFGVNVQFGGVEKGATAQYDRGSNTIYLNPSESIAVIRELAEGHELVHALEQTKNYKALSDLVVNSVFGGENSDAYITEATRIDELYRRVGQALTSDELKGEVVAEYFRTKVFKNAETLKQFVADNYKTAGGQFIDALKETAAKMQQVFGKTSGADVPSISQQVLDSFAVSMNQARRDANAKIRNERLNEVAEGYGLLNNAEQLVPEDVKDLVAVHNTTEEKLRAILEQGHFRMPSTAVTNKPFSDFGDISVVFRKDTIDPKVNSDNKLYGADAWTPTESPLNINPVFDEAKTAVIVNGIKDTLGDGAHQLFDTTVDEFKDSISSARGNIYDAYSENLGMQAAYALEQGLIPDIPMRNGAVDTAALKNGLDAKLNKDAVWRSYKAWLYNISDECIESYDKATTKDVLESMRTQPDTAKPFKLSENGELTVPATKYNSISEMKRNKGRLSEGADAKARSVGLEFISWANELSRKSGLSVPSIVNEINSSFDGRYDVSSIINNFAQKGIALTNGDAGRLQTLYRKAVELPTPYFEAKPSGAVGVDNIAAVVLPDNLDGRLKAELSARGIRTVDYKAGDNVSRAKAVNSLEDVKFLRLQNSGNDTKRQNLITINSTEKAVDSFEIKNMNDFVHVQRSVVKKLTEEGFFDDEGGRSKTVVNEASGMIVEINHSGIKETFGTEHRFSYLGKKLKRLKLATIRVVPEIIKHGILTNENVSNSHKDKSGVKYSYIICDIIIDGEPLNITIAVRKSLQKNKFWLHQIEFNNNTEALPAGTKSSKTELKNLGTFESISQNNDGVKRQNLITESSAREMENGYIPDEEFAEQARMEAAEYLDTPDGDSGEYIAKRYQQERDRFDTVLKDVDITRLSDPKYLKDVSGKLVEAYDIFKQVRRRADNVIFGLGDSYGRVEQREVERLLSGDLDLSEISSKANRTVVEKAYGILKHASDMEHKLWDARSSSKSRYTEFAKSILKESEQFRGLSGASTHLLTPARVLAKATAGTSAAGRFQKEVVRPLMENSAAVSREHADYVDRISKIGISKRKIKGDKLSEDAIIQCMEEINGKLEYWSKQKNYYKGKEHKSSSDNEKIKQAEDFIAKLNNDYKRMLEENPSIEKRLPELKEKAKKVRAIYDELFERINKIRVENGYEPIAYRRGYFIHYSAKETNFLHQFFDLTDKSDERQLSTSLLGITEHFTPGMAYSSWAQSRAYDQAQEYSVLRGFDNYLGSALDVIHHTEDIQRFRALENELRDKHMSPDAKRQIERIKADERLTFLEQMEAINKIHEKDGGALGNLAVFFHEEGNVLANKKPHLDRPFEKLLSPGAKSATGKEKWGERAYNGFNWLKKRVVSGLLGFNFSTALSNTEALMACNSDVKKSSFLKAGKEMVESAFRNDGFRDSSAFLTARGGQKQLNPLWIDNLRNASMWMMEKSDMAVSEWVTRAYYNDGISKGLSHEAAIEYADEKASACIGDRSKGMTPLVFSAKNPLMNTLTMFQLEVSNRFQWMFDGMSERKKKEGLTKVASFILGYCLNAYLFDDLYEKLLGRRIAFDPLSIANDAVGDLTGYKLDNFTDIIQNVVSGHGFNAFEKQEKEGSATALINAGDNVMNQMPFVSTLTGGGRIPVFSAVPDGQGLLNAVASDDLTWKEKGAAIGGELATGALTFALPTGGNQLKKTVQGAMALMEGGRYKTGTDGKRKLAYPIEAKPGSDKNLKENINAGLNAAKGLVFGRSAFDESRAWANRGYSYLPEPATNVYDEVVKKGVDKHKAFDTVYGVNNTGAVKGEDGFRLTSRAGARRELLLGSDLPADVKSYIDENLIQSGDNKKKVDYSQPEMVRAIEKYRDYTKDDDGKTNYEYFSEGLNKRETEILKLVPESNKGSLSRRMALFADNSLTPEQKNKFDAEWLSEIPEQKPSKEHYDKMMKTEPGFTMKYDDYVWYYNYIKDQPSRTQALSALIRKGPKLSEEMAFKLYKAFGIRHANDYRDDEQFYSSLLSDSQCQKAPYVIHQFKLQSHADFYWIGRVMSEGGTKKTQKIQALMNIGFTEAQAEAYYKAVN